MRVAQPSLSLDSAIWEAERLDKRSDFLSPTHHSPKLMFPRTARGRRCRRTVARGECGHTELQWTRQHPDLLPRVRDLAVKEIVAEPRVGASTITVLPRTSETSPPAVRLLPLVSLYLNRRRLVVLVQNCTLITDYDVNRCTYPPETPLGRLNLPKPRTHPQNCPSVHKSPRTSKLCSRIAGALLLQTSLLNWHSKYLAFQTVSWFRSAPNALSQMLSV